MSVDAISASRKQALNMPEGGKYSVVQIVAEVKGHPSGIALAERGKRSVNSKHIDFLPALFLREVCRSRVRKLKCLLLRQRRSQKAHGVVVLAIRKQVLRVALS